MPIRPETLARPLDEKITALKDVQRAVLNILEDFSTERLRLQDVQRATLNILQDFDAEKERLGDVQRATLNVLDDFHAEKTHLGRTQTATLNILDDLQSEKARHDEGQRALLNILDDMDVERRKVAAVNEQLEGANKELEAFTYSVAHDLRAPLRHVDGFAKLLCEEFAPQLDATAQHYLSRIQGGTRQMAQLVDDLLNLARVSRQELRLQVTGLKAVVDEVLANLRPETVGREIEWRIGKLPYVEGDPGLLRQVFANLLSNALKFTRPRPRAIIEVGTTERDRQAVIFVRDNGVGFSMKYAEKLFGVFQRLHCAEDFEGTGVGLATVQRIVHKHGGQVWAEAELDNGATFSFTLGSRPEPAAVSSRSGV